MKHICITKYVHSFTINKYTKSFLITNLTNLRYQPGCASGYIAGYGILNRTYADLKNPIIRHKSPIQANI